MQTADWGVIAAFAVVLVAVFLWLQRPTRAGSKTSPKLARGQIAIDGTNVMFWRNDQARVSTLKIVLGHLRRAGFDPVVFLDASSRHHAGDKSLSEQKFAQVLGIPQNRIMVCPARTEADAFLLQYAGAQKLAVVSNDRFRDRPREARNIRLVKGHFEGDRLVMKGL